MSNVKKILRKVFTFNQDLDEGVLDKQSKELAHQFETALGENLYALIQYGSSIKGGANRSSNLNLLIVLNISTPESHQAIHEIVLDNSAIEPFIMGKRGLDRTMHCFAIKFLSIGRHYKLLSGHDFLPDFTITVEHERFLAEQALRNLRLRIVQSYAKKGASKVYLRFIASQSASIFVDIAEVLRCQKETVPDSYLERIPVFEQMFGLDFSVLKDVLSFKTDISNMTSRQTQLIHRNLFILIDNILQFIEKEWHE